MHLNEKKHRQHMLLVDILGTKHVKRVRFTGRLSARSAW